MWSNQCSVQCAVCAIFIQTETGFRLAPLAHLCTPGESRPPPNFFPRFLHQKNSTQQLFTSRAEGGGWNSPPIVKRSLFSLKLAVQPSESACAGAGIDVNIFSGAAVHWSPLFNSLKGEGLRGGDELEKRTFAMCTPTICAPSTIQHCIFSECPWRENGLNLEWQVFAEYKLKTGHLQAWVVVEGG